jgi:hypothetical protein
VKKPTALQAVIYASTIGVAARLAHQLATHDVSVYAITSTVLAVLSTGLFLESRLSNAGRTTHYTCPAKGCQVAITARATSPAESERLQTIATDHSKHGSS